MMIPVFEGCGFESFVCCKNCDVCLKRTKIKNEKETGDSPLIILCPEPSICHTIGKRERAKSANLI